MASGRELNAQIVLTGRIDDSLKSIERWLNNVGGQLTSLGAATAPMAAGIVKLGKDAIDLYTDFDDAMRYIQGLGELNEEELEQVEKAARDAGATTRYTALDAANAMTTVAVAGYDFKKNIELLPVLLNMAAAGNMSLADASSQLTTALAVTGTAVEDADDYVDKLAKTSARSKSDISGLGEAVQRLGATGNYLTGGTTELLTLLGSIGQLGAQEAEMGTYARNIILSLVAPTDKAAEAMDLLGFSAEEVEEALDGIDSADAKRALQELNLEIYDADTGKLRNIFETFQDLDKAMAHMSDEEKRNKTMSTLFNNRTLGYAEGLLKIVREEVPDFSWVNLWNQIDDSAGYAQQVASQREAGLGGQLRRLKSEWAELQLSWADPLSDRVSGWVSHIESAVNYLAGLDEETKNRWLNVAEGIVGISAVSTGLGIAAKAVGAIITAVTTPAGALVVSGAALGLVIKYLDQLHEMEKEADLAERFGVIELDPEEYKKSLEDTRSQFITALESFDQYDEKVNAALATYQEATRTLSANLLSSLVTGATLTEEDKKLLEGMGERIYTSLIDAIEARRTETGSIMDAFFGDYVDEEGNQLTGAAAAKAALDEYYSGLTAEAAEISQQMRAQMASALQDGELDADEQAAIDATIGRYNQIMAKIADATAEEEWYTTLEGLTRQGRDSIDQMVEQAEAELRARQETVWGARDKAAGAYRQAYEAGTLSQDEYEAALQETDERAQAEIQQSEEDVRRSIMLAASDTLRQGYEDVLRDAEQVITQASENDFWEHGEDALKWGRSDYLREIDPIVFENLNEYLKTVLEGLGIEDVAGLDRYREAYGEEAWFQDFERMMQRLGLITGYLKFEDYGRIIQGETTGASQGGVVASVQEEGLGQGEQPRRMIRYGADTSEAKSEIDKLNNQTVTVRVRARMISSVPSLAAQLPGFSEGGRSDEPAIFGEGDTAEWAIPEEHTPQTASLLKQAIQASGFTLQEIAGGDSGGRDLSASGQYIFNYAPVINANDTQGIEQVLGSDRERFKKWFRDAMRDMEDEKMAASY